MKNGYDHHDHQDIYTYNLSGPKRFTLDVPNQSLPLLVTCYIRFGQTYPNFTVFYHRLQSYKCGKSAHFHAKGFVLNTSIKCGPWTQQQYQYRRHSRAIGDDNIKTDETITKSSESELYVILMWTGKRIWGTQLQSHQKVRGDEMNSIPSLCRQIDFTQGDVIWFISRIIFPPPLIVIRIWVVWSLDMVRCIIVIIIIIIIMVQQNNQHHHHHHHCVYIFLSTHIICVSVGKHRPM